MQLLQIVQFEIKKLIFSCYQFEKISYNVFFAGIYRTMLVLQHVRPRSAFTNYTNYHSNYGRKIIIELVHADAGFPNVI